MANALYWSFMAMLFSPPEGPETGVDCLPGTGRLF
jgi:hypothetical protein